MALFRKRQLVAVMGGADGKSVRRIARVVYDDGGPKILVETDSELEGEAAVEYDFETPEPDSFEVDRYLLWPVLEE